MSQHNPSIKPESEALAECYQLLLSNRAKRETAEKNTNEKILKGEGELSKK